MSDQRGPPAPKPADIYTGIPPEWTWEDWRPYVEGDRAMQAWLAKFAVGYTLIRYGYPAIPETICGREQIAGRSVKDYRAGLIFLIGAAVYNAIDWIFTPSKNQEPWTLVPAPPPGTYMFPVVVDLYGNGIKSVSVDQGPFFDYKGDGFAEKSGWVSPGEGLLCMDRNGNGAIDDGSELFGGQTPLPNGQLAANGFQALATLDSNHDGKIDSQDPAYSQLRVWVDSDTDGVSQPGELQTMPQVGITSIDLNWTTVNTIDAQGNIEYSVGSFQYTDRSTGLIADYMF
jgi:hypothetical protein